MARGGLPMATPERRLAISRISACGRESDELCGFVSNDADRDVVP
jgi:hypothetical protein